MPLSAYEQKVLEQMERHLAQDDPKLASAFAEKKVRQPGALRRRVILVIGLAVGLAGIVIGIVVGFAIYTAMGLLVVFASIAQYAVAQLATPGFQGAQRVHPLDVQAAQKKDKSSRLARFEERWDRRQGYRGQQLP